MKSQITITDKFNIREHLEHGKGNRKVVVHNDNTVSYYGSTDDFNRQHDYWHYAGTCEEILANIKVKKV